MKNAFIGLISGLICGLLGAGGGLILVPAFCFINKLDEKVARATSIFCMVPLVIVSCIFYINNKYIDWNIGLKCAIGGVLGALFGSILLKKMNKNTLNILFTAFLLYVAIKMMVS